MAKNRVEYEIRARDKTEKATKGAKKNLDDLQGQSKKFGRLLKTGAFAAGAAAGIAALNKIGQAASKAVDAYREQEQAERRLAQAARNNPYLNSDNVRNIQNFASELQKVSTIGDETAISLASMAAASGRTETEIQNMVQAAADVSAAMGITMESAMRSLNKSFGGMTGELGELIPSLKDLSREQLENGEAVDLLRRKFDGAAEAIGDTATGSLQQFGNALGDLVELGGGAIANFIEPAVAGMTKFVEKIQESIQESRNLRATLSGAGDEAGVSTREQIRILDERIAERRANMGQGLGRLNNAAREQTLELQRQELNALIQQRDAAQDRLDIQQKYDSLHPAEVARQERLADIEEQRGKFAQLRVTWSQAMQDAQEKATKGIISAEQADQRRLDAHQNFLEVSEQIYDALQALGAPTEDIERLMRLTREAAEGVRDATGEAAENAKGLSQAGIAKFNRSAGLSGYQAPGASASGRAARASASGAGGGGMSALNQVASQLAQSLGLVSQATSAAAGAVNAFMGGILKTVGPLVNEALPLLHGMLSVLGQVIGTIGLPILSAMFGGLEILGQGFLWFYNKILRKVGNFFIDIAGSIAIMFESVINAVIEGVNKIPGVNQSKVDFSSRIGEARLPKMGREELTTRGRETADLPTGGAGSPEGAGDVAAGRKINVTVNVNTDVVAGEGGLRELAVMIRDEIRAAEALGA